MGVLCCGLALLVMTACFINTYSAPITCDAGTYVVGQPASITCNFRTNISASQQSFNMARYPPTAKQGEIGTDVLVCHWSDENQKHDCTVTYGYTFDNVITDQVTVILPETEETFVGLYMCFFVPSQGKDTHACDFKITLESRISEKELNDSHTSTPLNEDDTSNTALIAGVCVIVFVLVVGSATVSICCWQRHKNSRSSEQGASREMESLIAPKNKQVKTRLKDFNLSLENLNQLMGILDQEINKGINGSARSEEDVMMYPVYCPMPDGSEVGDFLEVDFGSTGVKVSNVGRRKDVYYLVSESYPFRINVKDCSSEQMIDCITGAIHRFVTDKKLSGKSRKTAVIVRFPCHHKDISKASLARWTKEIRCEGIVGQDLNELLQKALKKEPRGEINMDLNIVAIVNDTVFTLMSVAHHNLKCKISCVLGSGLNACFVNTWQKEASKDAEDDQLFEVVYNTELGALGEKGSLDFLRTKYDKDLDQKSSIPNSQILEKMVSMTYLGEIVRLVLEDLKKDELMFCGAPSCPEQGSFTSESVVGIDRDSTADFRETGRILADLGMLWYTMEDLKIVKYVCKLTIERAAILAAAGLATLINHLNQPDLVIVVDGELTRKLPCFYDLMYRKTQELVNPKLKERFFLVSSFNGGRFRAANIAAAVLLKQNKEASGT